MNNVRTLNNSSDDETVDQSVVYGNFQTLYEDLRKAFHESKDRNMYCWNNGKIHGFVLDCVVLKFEYLISYKNSPPSDQLEFITLALEQNIVYEVMQEELQNLLKTKEVLES